MQTTVYNEKMLDVIVADMYKKFSEYKSLNIAYDKPFKPKTKKQLGFFFGALCNSIKNYYKGLGDDSFTTDEIQDNLKDACSAVNDRLLKRAKKFNGEEYLTPKRLSEMSVEEASILIDLSIRVIDTSEYFKGIILHPSIRYSWVHDIDADQIRQLAQEKYPREDKDYLAYIRGQACIWCGKCNCSEPHHLKIAGESGEAYKSSDVYAIPLCHDCHIGCLHQHGVSEFKESLKWITDYIDMKSFCQANYLRWKNKL